MKYYGLNFSRCSMTIWWVWRAEVYNTDLIFLVYEKKRCKILSNLPKVFMMIHMTAIIMKIVTFSTHRNRIIYTMIDVKSWVGGQNFKAALWCLLLVDRQHRITKIFTMEAKRQFTILLKINEREENVPDWLRRKRVSECSYPYHLQPYSRLEWYLTFSLSFLMAFPRPSTPNLCRCVIKRMFSTEHGFLCP